MVRQLFPVDVVRLVDMKELLQKAQWEPAPPVVTPLSLADADRKKTELQVAYLQHRMLLTRGDL